MRRTSKKTTMAMRVARKRGAAQSTVQDKKPSSPNLRGASLRDQFEDRIVSELCDRVHDCDDDTLIKMLRASCELGKRHALQQHANRTAGRNSTEGNSYIEEADHENVALREDRLAEIIQRIYGLSAPAHDGSRAHGSNSSTRGLNDQTDAEVSGGARISSTA